MITLKNKETGFEIGKITEKQLQFLIDQLEEEHSKDQDYWINTSMIKIMKKNGGEKELLSMIILAMGDKDEIEIVWERI